jgi:glutathione S-transferase
VGADESVLQDSTPTIEALEARYPEPGIVPEDPQAAFVSTLLEDYADEWVNKAMFHYRWTYEPDQLSAAKRIVDMMFEGVEIEDRRPAEAQVRERMTGRLAMVGSSPETAGVIERSFRRLADYLEAHLRGRPYLFGGRPALADFGLAAQLYELSSDPTPGGVLRAHHPHVMDWIDRMLEPAAQGPFEPFAALADTLRPLLAVEIGALYLPWMLANEAAVQARHLRLETTLDASAYAQDPQRYAAKAFAELRRKFAGADEAVRALMSDLGCAEALAPRPTPAQAATATQEEAAGGDDDADGDGED